MAKKLLRINPVIGLFENPRIVRLDELRLMPNGKEGDYVALREGDHYSFLFYEWKRRRVGILSVIKHGMFDQWLWSLMSPLIAGNRINFERQLKRREPSISFENWADVCKRCWLLHYDGFRPLELDPVIRLADTFEMKGGDAIEP